MVTVGTAYWVVVAWVRQNDELIGNVLGVSFIHRP
jgi:hypothetical protein